MQPTANKGPTLDTCRLVRAASDALQFRGRGRSRSPLIIAPPALVLAGLPWFSSGPLTWLQLSASGCFLSMSAALLIMGWPHRTSIEVFPRSASLRHRGKPHALTLPLHWRLVLSPPHLAPQCRYVAGLQSADGRFWQLLSGPRPDQILEELNQCNEVWPLKVESGWGLDSTAQPWKFGRLTVPVKRPVEAAARSLRAPRTDIQLPKVMTFLTVAVAALLLVQYLQGTNRHLNFNWASTLLPLLLVGQLVFAAFASSARSQMRCSSHAVYLRGGIFGSASKTVPRDAVRGVCLVGRSEAAEVCHLLLDTDHGPLASRVRSEAAKAFLREAEETLQIRN